MRRTRGGPGKTTVNTDHASRPEKVGLAKFYKSKHGSKYCPCFWCDADAHFTESLLLDDCFCLEDSNCTTVSQLLPSLRGTHARRADLRPWQTARDGLRPKQHKRPRLLLRHLQRLTPKSPG